MRGEEGAVTRPTLSSAAAAAAGRRGMSPGRSTRGPHIGQLSIRLSFELVFLRVTQLPITRPADAETPKGIYFRKRIYINIGLTAKFNNTFIRSDHTQELSSTSSSTIT